MLAAVEARPVPSSRRGNDGLVVASDGSWVRNASGQLAKLGTERPIARVMFRLALERMRHPGRPVPPHALVRAGWLALGLGVLVPLPYLLGALG